MSDLAWMQEEATTFLLVAAVVRFFAALLISVRTDGQGTRTRGVRRSRVSIDHGPKIEFIDSVNLGLDWQNQDETRKIDCK